MSTGKHCLTPLAAVAGGLLAGVVGTVCRADLGVRREDPGLGPERPARRPPLIRKRATQTLGENAP